MATVVVTLKIMPEGVETDLDRIEEEATRMISEFGGETGKAEKKPIAFGLKALEIFFTMPEEKGSTEELEKKIAGIDGVQSAEAVDVRRAVG